MQGISTPSASEASPNGTQAGAVPTIEYSENVIGYETPYEDVRAGLHGSWNFETAVAIEVLYPTLAGIAGDEGTWRHLDADPESVFPEDVVRRATAVVQSRTHVQLRCPLCGVNVNFSKYLQHTKDAHGASVDARRDDLSRAGVPMTIDQQANSPWRRWVTSAYTISRSNLWRVKQAKLEAILPDPDRCDWASLIFHPNIARKAAPGEEPSPLVQRSVEVPVVDACSVRPADLVQRLTEPETGPPFQSARLVPMLESLAAAAGDGDGGQACTELERQTPIVAALRIAQWVLEVAHAVVHISNRTGSWRAAQPPLHVFTEPTDLLFDPRRGVAVIAVRPELVEYDEAVATERREACRVSLGDTLTALVDGAVAARFSSLQGPIEGSEPIKPRDGGDEANNAGASRGVADPALQAVAKALRRVRFATAKLARENCSWTLDEGLRRIQAEHDALLASTGPEGAAAATSATNASNLGIDSRQFFAMRDVVCTAVADGMLQAASRLVYGGCSSPNDAVSRVPRSEAVSRQTVSPTVRLPGLWVSDGWSFEAGWRVLRYAPDTSVACVRWWAEALLVPGGEAADSGMAPCPASKAGSPPMRLQLADIDPRDNLVSKKAECLRKALQANPGFEPALASLAILKAEHPESFTTSAASSVASSAASTPRGRVMPVVDWHGLEESLQRSAANAAPAAAAAAAEQPLPPPPLHHHHIPHHHVDQQTQHHAMPPAARSNPMTQPAVIGGGGTVPPWGGGDTRASGRRSSWQASLSSDTAFLTGSTGGSSSPSSHGGDSSVHTSASESLSVGGVTAVQRDAQKLLAQPGTMVLQHCVECNDLVPQLVYSEHGRRHQALIRGVPAVLHSLLQDDASAVWRRVREVSGKFETDVRVTYSPEDPTQVAVEVRGHEAGSCAPAILAELMMARYTHRPYRRHPTSTVSQVVSTTSL